jgi:VanZ family protein
MNAWLWAAIAWIGVIFFSSTTVAGKSSEEAFSALSKLLLTHLQPGTSPYDLVHLLADKSVHVGLFFVFAMLLWRALPNAPGRVISILVAGAVVGSCSELLQMLFPGRDPAFRDVLINIGGTALGLGVSFGIGKLHSGARQFPKLGTSSGLPHSE